MPAHAEKPCAALLGGANAGEVFGSMAQNVRHTGQGLHIVDDGRAREKTRNGREGRLESGEALSTLERSQQGGLFATDIRPRTPVNDDIQIKAGPLDILAQPPLGIGLVQGALQALRRAEVLAPNVDVGLMAADGIGCDDHAFQQGVRVPLHDVAVLEGTGLTLVRVDHQVFGLGRFLGNKGPLPAGWKPGPAQTTQVGSGNLVDHLCRGHGSERFPGREISVISDVVLEPGPVRIFEAGGKHRPAGPDERFRFRQRSGVFRNLERSPKNDVQGLPLERPQEGFVELGHGRHFAGAQTLDLGEGDLLARGGLAGANLQTFFDLIQHLPRTAQQAGQAGADPKLAPTHRLGVKHGVKGDRFAHLRTGHPQDVCHPCFRLLGDVTLMFLDQPQQRQHRCLRLLV